MMSGENRWRLYVFIPDKAGQALQRFYQLRRLKLAIPTEQPGLLVLFPEYAGAVSVLAREFSEANPNDEDFAMANVEKVIDYIKTVELNAAGSIDHLGDSLESIFYPSSIWVDSLMIFRL